MPAPDRFPATRTRLISFPAELSPLLFYQTIQLVEQFAITFADGIHDASQHRLNSLRAVTQQAIDHIFADAVLEFFTGNRGRIEERSPIFAPVENLFSKQAIERGHQRRIRDSLFEGYVDVAHADLSASPRFFQDLPLEFPERQRGHFARPAKSA